MVIYSIQKMSLKLIYVLSSNVFGKLQVWGKIIYCLAANKSEVSGPQF